MANEVGSEACSRQTEHRSSVDQAVFSSKVQEHRGTLSNRDPPDKNAGDRDADVFEVGCTELSDTVKCSSYYFRLYLLKH